MHDYALSIKLKKIFGKIYSKDKARYEAAMKKVEEVSNSENLEHYKNLRYSMKRFKRVHIDSHLVLVFRLENNIIHFENLQHHDYIYR